MSATKNKIKARRKNIAIPQYIASGSSLFNKSWITHTGIQQNIKELEKLLINQANDLFNFALRLK